MPLGDALGAFLQAFATNLVQAGIRLGVTGQQGAVAAVAGLEPPSSTLRAGPKTPRWTISARATVLSDIVAMRHEMQHSRLFRS